MKKKRIFCLILALVMIITTFPLALPVSAGGVTEEGLVYRKEAGALGGGPAQYLVYITGYSGDAKNIVIPPSIEGCLVVGIDAFAFEGHFNIESIYIPYSVDEIENGAFYCCYFDTIVVDAT